MGISMQVRKEDMDITVSKVKEDGAIPEWNRKCKLNGFPQNSVQEGDRIEIANGRDLPAILATSSVQEMNGIIRRTWEGEDDKRAELRSLLLTVCRPKANSSSATASC